MNAHCFLCFYSTRHINGLRHDNTGSIHMLLAYDLHAVVWQESRFSSGSHSLLRLLEQSVIGGWIMHEAADWNETLFWVSECGKHELISSLGQLAGVDAAFFNELVQSEIIPVIPVHQMTPCWLSCPSPPSPVSCLRLCSKPHAT